MIKEIVDVEMAKFFLENKFIDFANWVLNWSEYREDEDS